MRCCGWWLVASGRRENGSAQSCSEACHLIYARLVNSKSAFECFGFEDRENERKKREERDSCLTQLNSDEMAVTSNQ